MTPEFGRRVYTHVTEAKPEQVLELGTAHGVSAAYIAAALEANGRGHLTTVDHGGAHFDPPPSRTNWVNEGCCLTISSKTAPT